MPTEIPKFKSQAPRKISINNFQKSSLRKWPFWKLKFGYSLGFKNWDLELRRKAVELGWDVDKPRNLAKSVTVE